MVDFAFFSLLSMSDIMIWLAGERVFDFFTPGEIGQHLVLFTYSMLFVCFIVFFYMIGAYPMYIYLSSPSSLATCVSAADSPQGRSLFVHWMFPRVSGLVFIDGNRHATDQQQEAKWQMLADILIPALILFAVVVHA